MSIEQKLDAICASMNAMTAAILAHAERMGARGTDQIISASVEPSTTVNQIAQVATPVPVVAAPVAPPVAVAAPPIPVTAPVVEPPMPVAPVAAPVAAPAPVTALVTAPQMPPAPQFMAPPAAVQAAPTAPFSNGTSMVQYVMKSYQELGPQKGAGIQQVLTSLGYANINDVQPGHYDALFSGIEALKA